MILFKSEYYFNQRYFQFRVEKIFPRTFEKFPLWEEVKAWWHGIKTVHARFPTRQFRVPRKNIEYTFQARNHPSPGDALLQQWWWWRREPWHNNSCFMPCTHRVHLAWCIHGSFRINLFHFQPAKYLFDACTAYFLALLNIPRPLV